MEAACAVGEERRESGEVSSDCPQMRVCARRFVYLRGCSDSGRLSEKGGPTPSCCCQTVHTSRCCCCRLRKETSEQPRLFGERSRSGCAQHCEQ
ncbi:hypothetical protein MRX96_030057 [Rhipicephalus microplus]